MKILPNLCKSGNAFVALIIAVGFALRFCLYYSSPMHTADGSLGHAHFDAITYVGVMQFILDNGLTNYFSDEISVKIACGNPLYLAVLYSLFDGNFQYMRIFNIFISSVQIWLTYRIALTIFKNYYVGMLAAAFMAFNTHFIDYSYTLLTEPIFFLCCLCFVYFYLLARQSYQKSNRRFIIFALLSALFLTLTTMIRAIPTLLPIFLVAYYFFLYLRNKGTTLNVDLYTCSIIFVVFAVLLSPIIVKNHILFNMNGTATGSGAALYLGSHIETQGDEPAFYGKDYSFIYDVIGPRDHLLISSDKMLFAAAVETIKEHPWEYSLINIKKIARLTIGTKFSWYFGMGDNMSEVWQKDSKSALKLTMGIFLYTTVYAFCILGLCRCYKNKDARIILLLALYFLLFSLPFLALIRYGMAIMVLAQIVAAAEIVHLCTERKRKSLAVGFLMSIVMSAYICIGY